MFCTRKTLNVPLFIKCYAFVLKIIVHCRIINHSVKFIKIFCKMPRVIKQSTIEERKIVIQLHSDGKSEREISKLIKKSKSTVHDIIARYKENGLIANKPGGGRPKKLSSKDENMVLREVKKNPFISAPKLTAMVKEASGTEINPETIRRLLRKNDFHGRVARKKPLISKKNQNDRLVFARQYMAKDFDFWSKVINEKNINFVVLIINVKVLFTDESKFNLFGCDGRGKVWRKPNKELDGKNLKKTIKHGGGSVMVWGCMAASGVGNLHFIDGIMTKEVYLTILKQNLKESVKKLGIESDFQFYQDNDPKHSAYDVRNWLLYNCPKVIKTPAQSPDLNVIEHLWDELGRRMQDRQCSSIQSLKIALREEWNKISPDVCKKLVESMPSRLRAVENQKGGATKY